MSEADSMSLMLEASSCEPRGDADAMQRIVEEEQRRVAPRGPGRRLIDFVDDIQDA